MAASNIQTGQPVGEPWYVSLLGLAEHFRTSNPPNIKNCIHCLQSILTFKPSPRIAARVQLQLGTVLFQHTKNSDLAMKYLEAAWTTSQTIQSFEDVKFEAASMLARMCAKQDEMDRARSLLRKAVEMSQPVPYWHCRLLFQLAEIHSAERDYSTACVLLGLGIEYASVQGSEYTKLLFMLSKAMLLLISKQLQEVHQVLSTAGSCIEAWHTDSQAQKENLKVFFLVLQVCHYLLHGQVKSVKPALKQLQQSIQALSNMQTDDGIFYSTNRMEHFQWLSKEHLCVLVYLVTVMHSMQAGYMDKAQKYTDKALMQIEKLKMLDSHPLLSSFQMMLLEHIILCRLIMGNKSTAIQEISQACQLCQQQPRLLTAHRAQLHTLLGLYAMSMNCMEAAEAQFNTSLMNTGDLELSSFVYLHLAIVYIRTGRQGEMAALLQRLDPDRLQSGSHSLKASTYFVRGLQSFCGTRYSEAKKYLRETLKMANAEDLNRLTSCSLVLLGHVFLSLGNSQEALNMVTPAMQLASKIPDVHVQLWASSLLKDLYRVCGNHQRESESTQMHENFTQALLHDHFQASQLTEHQLIHWTQGECPAGISGASSSQHLGAAPVMGSSSSSTETSGSTDGASNTL